jgi:hypothetical protein
MAGLRGNQAWLLAMKQSGKLGAGAAPVPSDTVPNTAFKMPFSGGNIMPTRETDRLAETDASREIGDLYIQSTGVEGSPEFYVRDASIGFWLWAVMGAVAVTGTTNFVHTITPADSLPYIACWRNLSQTLYEEYKDCKVGSLNISAEAGQPLAATAGIQGLRATRLTATPDTASPVPLQNGAVFNYNDATVTLGGSATSLISSFDLTIENNLDPQQTDSSVPYDISEGQREISLGFDMIFENLDEYNKFHYGSASGTAITSTVFQTSCLFSFDLGANNAVSFDIPRLVYEEVNVEPNTNGEAIVASMRAVTKRGGTPSLTAVVKNQVTAY